MEELQSRFDKLELHDKKLFEENVLLRKSYNSYLRLILRQKNLAYVSYFEKSFLIFISYSNSIVNANFTDEELKDMGEEGTGSVFNFHPISTTPLTIVDPSEIVTVGQELNRIGNAITTEITNVKTEEVVSSCASMGHNRIDSTDEHCIKSTDEQYDKDTDEVTNHDTDENSGEQLPMHSAEPTDEIENEEAMSPESKLIVNFDDNTSDAITDKDVQDINKCIEEISDVVKSGTEGTVTEPDDLLPTPLRHIATQLCLLFQQKKLISLSAPH